VTVDDLAPAVAAAPSGDTTALASMIVAAVMQTSVWKWAEAAKIRDEVRGRHEERKAERTPAPELGYDSDDDLDALYDDQDGDLYDPGLDDDLY
jgi:hypothetical protein